MTRQLVLRRLVFLMSAAGIMSFHQSAMAAAFQLWEQDGASIGNYHAGRAAIAEDASTSYYNPAGLIRIKNQQVVFGADPILTDFRYKGTVKVDTLNDPTPQPVTAQGGGFNLIPFGHYASPICDCVVFGLSVDVPFGLQTNYGSNTILRYAATLTSLQVIDVSPNLGIALNDKFSIGFGVDWQHLNAEFDQTATFGDQTFDTYSRNTGTSEAWGYHLGALYQFTPQTRVGLSYHSKVSHRVMGKSAFVGPIANDLAGGTQASENLRAATTLPATTTLSAFHSLNCLWDIMGSVSYTQWNVFHDLILQNVAGILNLESTNTLPVIVHQNYHNSWSYAVGANYHPCQRWIIRTGLGFDQTPSTNQYRNVQLPDTNRIGVALGTHYQATRTLGFDISWAHVFGMNTRIHNLTQTTGDENVTTNGSVKAGADVYGFQVRWDLA